MCAHMDLKYTHYIAKIHSNMFLNDLISDTSLYTLTLIALQ